MANFEKIKFIIWICDVSIDGENFSKRCSNRKKEHHGLRVGWVIYESDAYLGFYKFDLNYTNKIDAILLRATGDLPFECKLK